MDLSIDVEKQGNCSVVKAIGRIDASTSDILEDAFMNLLDNGETKIILDMEKTEYISSAGLRVLVVITKQLYQSGHFCLCNANDNVNEILDMSGFHSFINSCDNLSEALENINQY